MSNINVKTKKNIGNITVMASAIVLALIIMISGNRTLPNLFSKICIFIIAALSMNIVCGNLGELVLGHGGFMLIGYCVSILFTNFFYTQFVEIASKSEFQNLFYSIRDGLQPIGYLYILVVTLLAGVITGFIGWLVGLIVMGRMKGDYLAIVTLGIGLVFVCLVQNLLPDGTLPLTITSKIAGNPLVYVLFMVVIVFVAILFITSRFGRGIISIREDAIASEASGIPVNKYKIMAFTVAAVLVGMAGALYSFDSPQLANAFNQDLSIELMLMIVLGGLGSYTGTIVAVPILIIFKQYILVIIPATINPKIIYGILLVSIMLFRNEGILGTKEFSWNWFNKTFKKINNWFKKTFKKKKLKNDSKPLGDKNGE